MATTKKETPLMKQYNAIKAKHPDALLLFRVGDFYETFGEDAVKASRILDIVLTKRANGSASHIELAGFPHHSLDTYLPKLVRAGNRVAICDQLEDPKSVKGIVKRGVTELVTPGLTLNDNVLDQKKNNYLASIAFGKDLHGIAFLDLSTGEFMVSAGDLSYIDKVIQGFNPSEVIYCKKNKEQFTKQFGEDFNTFCLEEWIYGFDFGYEKLNAHFNTKNLKGFGIEGSKEGICAAGAILFYLEETEHKEISHISSVSRIDTDKYVWLDKFTIRNLELVYAQQADGVPLLHVMDDTCTPMGARLLKKWMVLPLKEKAEIEARHNVVEALIGDSETTDQILSHLQQIGDVERLVSKVAALRINPRELLHLKKALKNIAPIKQILDATSDEYLKKFGDKLNPCAQLIEKIDLNLKEELPLNATQGNIIQDGIDTELDELRKIAFSGKDYLLQIQEREKERTGISSLKIAYNKVFGYYLEVSNAHKDKVPEEWIRKQTLVNAERYITEELKTYEEKILNAEEKLSSIELRLFNDLVAFTSDYVAEIQNNARNIAQIDCLVSFAKVAVKQNYCRPSVNDEKAIDIKEGRHPVIETQLPAGEEYISNSVFLDDISQQIMIITGPNMAGKSALLRQTALIVLMAQMGSYVPATYAKIGIIDKVFTRVGASDNLSKGESTFMVEMTETASILNNLSENSLVLMDEIGRGTSTYDGVSIAWSIVEHLHNHPKCHAKTMFATHYHELNQIAEDFPRVKNFNVSVKELDNRVIFMRKLKEGGSQHSFGIHVAQMAGMPNEVVIRSNEILQHLEKDKIKEQHDEKIESLPKNNFQLSMFESDPHFEEVLGLLNKLDVNTISPVEALLKLNEIKNILKGKG
ncbi:MAG: DNA mismatch repair protein MutS [Reichenbachiella sp.]|uniref:DNA mismatch repair protein MutS n=1 Tax=Reichenbachiella sp. TaxID=2184521 RepID=UPI00296706C1|nr:DNA mismatch repair protein MutS [Reichenbachiella sp.]MDW3208857.1 DNA mismatch repair protein MutS [Reichenbachiella sp.]